MFETVFLAVLSVFATAFVFLLWALYCNRRTYQDRKQRLRNISIGSDNFREQMDQFESVSYDEHFRARLLLQNPDRLYAKNL